MDTALRIIFLVITALPALVGFCSFGVKRKKGINITAKLLAVLYILTHTLVAGACLGEQVDYSTGAVMDGFYLISSSYLLMILFYLYEVLAVFYTVMYIIRTRNTRPIKAFSCTVASLTVLIGAGITATLWFAAENYIDWTCIFFFIPYFLYAALLFVIANQNAPQPKPGVRQVLLKNKLKK
ncbi:MAG TPA: hypothetical protein PLT66_06740 [Bacillota bacterium]|nr:hypothetical protein [Bacillota bacterium]